MSTDKTPSLSLRDQIKAIAGTASEDERKRVTDLIAQAHTAKYGASTFVTLTAPMMAVIFDSHNGYNRDWLPATSTEYARQMTKGLWQDTNATIGIYTDGLLEDGQHRLAAGALAGFTWRVHVIFGIAHTAIGAVDKAKARFGWQTMHFDKVVDARRKHDIVKSWRAYEKGRGNEPDLKSELEIQAFITENDHQLGEAMAIGTAATKTVASPILKEEKIQAVAFIFLRAGRPREQLLHYLSDQQAGQSRDGDSAPFFVAAQMITKAAQARERRDRLTTTRELGIVVHAVLQAEAGFKAVSPKSFRDAVKGRLPDPAVPVATQAAA
jgi:hypothetical protein